MQVDYAPFVDRMINKYEGGYGWNKKDPGGPTKYGITCYDLAEHRKLKMTSMTTWAPIVQAMTMQEAEAIYQTKYAVAIGFASLPAGVDCCVMDYAVNSGVARAQLVMKQLGDPTKDPKKYIDDMCTERLRFMHAIRGGSAWVEFGHGWQARVTDLQSYAEHLAAGSTHETAPATAPIPATPKAINVAKPAPGGGSAGGVVIATGLAIHEGIPLWHALAAAAGIIVAGVAYSVWADSRATAANNLVHA